MVPFVSERFSPKHMIELNLNGFVWIPFHKFSLYHTWDEIKLLKLL